jgi:hypothetical protein
MNTMSKNDLKTLTMCRCSLDSYSQKMAQLEVLFQIEKRSTLKFKVSHVPCLFFIKVGHELVGRNSRVHFNDKKLILSDRMLHFYQM